MKIRSAALRSVQRPYAIISVLGYLENFDILNIIVDVRVPH
jgi:hypothetical protein